MLYDKIIRLIIYFVPICLTILVELICKVGLNRLFNPARSEHMSRVAGIGFMLVGYFWFVSSDWISIDDLGRAYQWNARVTLAQILMVIASFAFGWMVIRRQVKRNEHLDQIPSEKKWDYLVIWIIYLLVYEYYFRALLFPYSTYDLTTAIAINLAFYVAAHLHHGKEAIGAIPYGIVICLVTKYTGTLWSAYLSHLAIAFTVQFLGRGHFLIHFNRLPNFLKAKS